MRKMITLLLIALVSAVFAMCTPKNEIPVESSWSVEKIYTDGDEICVPEGHSPYLAFLADKKISGETGCNRFFGDYAAKGKNLTFTNVGSTRMMCPQMAFENAFIGAINETAQFTLAGDTMALKDNDGNIIALLKKIEPTSLEN